MFKSLEGVVENRRILVVDDTESIHQDFKKILIGHNVDTRELDDMEALLFGDDTKPAASNSGPAPQSFEMDSAYQGDQALACVQQAIAEGRPYAMTFIDVRMPPGWDGVETLSKLWEVDPNLQAVICTAYSDYSWDEMIDKLGNPDRLLILKKPFDNIEVYQAANALVSKWNWSAKAAMKMEQLEHLVAERTEKLSLQKQVLQEQLQELEHTRLQLVQTEKLASIGQLAAGVAHEINNPMGFISSNLNTLRDYISDIESVVTGYRGLTQQCLALDGEIHDQAKAVTDAEQAVGLDFVIEDIDSLLSDTIEGTQRVKRIVGDLTEFSHVNSPDIVETDLNELLEKTISVAWNELKYKAEVVREFGELPFVRCYGGRLAQVFLNLLVNAAHSIAERGTITVRTGMAGERVWIEIEDTGCGIEQAAIAKIFDPFFTTKDVGKGTGLGLHIVQSVIERHQGAIRVTSEMGKGTTFHIELPLVCEDDKQAKQLPPAQLSPAANSLAG